jgi:hypothetical protein
MIAACQRRGKALLVGGIKEPAALARYIASGAAAATSLVRMFLSSSMAHGGRWLPCEPPSRRFAVKRWSTQLTGP